MRFQENVPAQALVFWFYHDSIEVKFFFPEPLEFFQSVEAEGFGGGDLLFFEKLVGQKFVLGQVFGGVGEIRVLVLTDDDHFPTCLVVDDLVTQPIELGKVLQGFDQVALVQGFFQQVSQVQGCLRMEAKGLQG